MAEPLGKPAARLCPSCGVGGEVASMDSIQWLPSKNESYVAGHPDFYIKSPSV